MFHFVCQIWRFISTIGTCLALSLFLSLFLSSTSLSLPFFLPLSFSLAHRRTATVIVKNRSCHADTHFLQEIPFLSPTSDGVNFSSTSRSVFSVSWRECARASGSLFDRVLRNGKLAVYLFIMRWKVTSVNCPRIDLLCIRSDGLFTTYYPNERRKSLLP